MIFIKHHQKVISRWFYNPKEQIKVVISNYMGSNTDSRNFPPKLPLIIITHKVPHLGFNDNGWKDDCQLKDKKVKKNEGPFLSNSYVVWKGPAYLRRHFLNRNSSGNEIISNRGSLVYPSAPLCNLHQFSQLSVEWKGKLMERDVLVLGVKD